MSGFTMLGSSLDEPLRPSVNETGNHMRKIFYAASTALLSLGVSSAAGALVFDSPIAYQENFDGEVGYPTTPDFDAFGAGGVVDRVELGPPPTLIGGAVRETAGAADFEDGVEVEIDHEIISTLASEVGVRADFAGLDFVGDGTARINVFAFFALDDEPGVSGTAVGVSFEVRRIDGAFFGRFRFIEEHTGPGAEEFLTLNETFVDQTLMSAIDAGVPFTIDVEIDRAAATARASLQVGAQPELLAPPIALTLAHDYSITRVSQFLSLLFYDEQEVEVDLDRIQIFAEPHIFEPLLNLDLGSFWGVPDPTYGAAGSPGVWNEVGIGANALVDLAGNATALSAELTAESLGQVQIDGDDVRNLMSDWAADPSGWALYIDGLLDPGAYRVTYYATAAGAAETGLLSTNGLLTNSVPGVGGIPWPVTIEGITYTKVETIADAGALDLFSDTVGGETQLSGVQVERTVVVPESGFGIGILCGVGVLMSVGRQRANPRADSTLT